MTTDQIEVLDAALRFLAEPDFQWSTITPTVKTTLTKHYLEAGENPRLAGRRIIIDAIARQGFFAE